VEERAVLEVQGIGKAYRMRPVLRDVGFAVRPGECVALLGSNGAGKSTLLGCLTGDRLPDRGTVRVCGADPFSDPRAAAGCMGVVPERPFLYEELTVAELLRFVAAARNLPESEAAAEADRLLGLLGLRGAEELLCRELSQGMGRKTALTVALLHRPRAILLDEALNGLDAPSVRRVVEELDRRRADGAAVLLSSHDLELVAEWCDRGILLAPGARWASLEGGAWEAWRAAPTLELTAGSGE
jgi:ABC-2 type transport system ATP-binding protein